MPETGRAPRSHISDSLNAARSHSYGEDVEGNCIIQADNASALRVLKELYKDRVKCVYIDPPYNNRDRYVHYSDSVSSDQWLEALLSRATDLRDLLSPDGSLWVSIDENEVHYLKVGLDSVFGRENFVTSIVWQQRTTRENRKVFSNNHEYVLVYAKSAKTFGKTRGRIPPTSEWASRFKNPDADVRGPWQSVSANAQAGHATSSQFYTLKAPNGTLHMPPPGRCWVYTKSKMAEVVADNRVWFGRNGDGVPRIKKFLSESDEGMTPHTLWLAEEVGTNDSAKKHSVALALHNEIFETPKPEELLQRILLIATKPGDLVLDAYLGSGTTAAVAHKMGRQYIGIEIGDHAATHCVERLRKVVAGEGGGISKSLSWSGGGGFSFLRAATG